MNELNEEYAAIIPTLPLFKGVTLAGAQMLMEPGEVKELASGETLFKEGDPPDSVLLLLSGRLMVFVTRDGKDLSLTTSEPGALLGEVGVLCGMPRSASVRAIERSVVLRWDPEAFRKLMLRNAYLSERIFANSMRTVIEKEKSLIQSLTEEAANTR